MCGITRYAHGAAPARVVPKRPTTPSRGMGWMVEMVVLSQTEKAVYVSAAPGFKLPRVMRNHRPQTCTGEKASTQGAALHPDQA